jgi:hypothetical protein
MRDWQHGLLYAWSNIAIEQSDLAFLSQTGFV